MYAEIDAMYEKAMCENVSSDDDVVQVNVSVTWLCLRILCPFCIIHMLTNFQIYIVVWLQWLHRDCAEEQPCLFYRQEGGEAVATGHPRIQEEGEVLLPVPYPQAKGWH
jgi:hypothetical protein